MIDKKAVRRPSPLYNESDDRIALCVLGGWIAIGAVAMTANEAKALHAWLGRAIAWAEHVERMGASRG